MCKVKCQNGFTRSFFLGSLLLAGLVASDHAVLQAWGVTANMHFGRV